MIRPSNVCARSQTAYLSTKPALVDESVDEERESTPVHDDDDDEPSVRVREDVDVPIYPAATVVVIAAAGRTGPQSGVLFDKA